MISRQKRNNNSFVLEISRYNVNAIIIYSDFIVSFFYFCTS